MAGGGNTHKQMWHGGKGKARYKVCRTKGRIGRMATANEVRRLRCGGRGGRQGMQQKAGCFSKPLTDPFLPSHGVPA